MRIRSPDSVRARAAAAGWFMGTAGFTLATAAAMHAQPDIAALAADAAAPLASIWDEIHAAGIRLPLAAVFGTALALRPRRPGTPERTMSVVETQIILAIVGALIMLIVGASLARAFGIVGAANLIRYRAKIDNPKDAVVMLAALAVGLACGVGLYFLAGIGTVFIVGALWIIESFEPSARKTFELSIQVKDGKVADLRPQIETVLRRFHATFELRASADDSVTYAVETPATVHIDRISTAFETAAQRPGLAVVWDEQKPKKVS